MANVSDGSFPAINPAAFNTLKTESKKTKGNLPLRTAKKDQFAELLRNTVREIEPPQEYPVSEETIEKLLDAVHTAGDELKDRPFPEEISRYKQAVRNFLHYVVENGYNLEEATSGVNILKRKKFIIIQVVDKKLEELALGLLKNQTSQIALLARIDEIAGLLVDLLQ
jgi:uncharacterized protein YaaR (DUF327 family)